MKDKARIEVLVTDGIEIRRLLWVQRKPNGVYFGMCNSMSNEFGEIMHFSYHEDGNRFLTLKGKKMALGVGQRLSEFKGIFHIGQTVDAWVGKDVGHELYQYRKLYSAIYIDRRNFESGLNMHLWLLEPFRFELLTNELAIERGNLGEFSEIHIFSSLEPWIVVAYRASASAV